MVRVLNSAAALSLLGSVEVFGEMDDNVVAVGRADHPPTAALIGSLCVPSPRGHERATEGDSVDRAGDLDESAGAEDRR